MLAVNPRNARSQDQLHIHISCASTATAAALKDADTSTYAHWAPLPMQPNGQPYHALAMNDQALHSANLFRAVHDKVAADKMQINYAAVAIANVAPGQFLLLVGEGSESQPVAAESLQDHNCALAKTG